jgi:competence transcription factor ComK
MSTQKEIKYTIHKRKVYVVRIGPMYVWGTISYTKDECIRKALEFCKVKSYRDLKYKGAEIVILFTKEIIQENNSNKSV